MTELVKGRDGHYTDDSGICSYSSSAVGSVSSSSTNYLSSLKNISDSSETMLPPVSVHLVIPELEIETPLQLNQNDSIWNIKQCILCTIATNLDDGMNHGIYCPPVNGRAGKYLDEERNLGEYNLQEDTVLHLVRKRRVYKSASFDWKKIQEFNTKARCKKLIHYLRSGNLEKLDKLLARGLDPNFQDESGETALTMAVNARYSRDLIMTLVEGGALLDYRNRFGATALHRAAQFGNKEAVQTLLELGSAPNYKDARGLTPLYYTVCHSSDADCTELLLRDYSILGVRDESGWTELHQACRFGRVQHLQHLIFYGSDVNARNFSGNTPLHVCALNNQEECARILLFRGADKTLRNFINQEAESLANLNGHPRLADIIRQFNHRDIVLYQDKPLYNTRRRRLTKSYHSGADENGDESWNLFQLQQHLSRSTSHLPDCSSSDVFSSASSGRKSRADSHYQSISRSSSISRKGSQRRSRSSSRPSSQSAFDEPDTLKQPQKPSKTTNLMSCDAAGQRSRARSRSRAGGLASVFDRFKTAQNSEPDGGRLNGTLAGCSSLPTPPSSFDQPVPVSPAAVPISPAPPPRRESAADAYLYKPPPPPSPMPIQNNPVACLRDVFRPKSETGSGQAYAWRASDNLGQGHVSMAPRWFPDGENQRQVVSAFRLQRPPFETNPTEQQRGPSRISNKTEHMVGNQFRSPGHQSLENQSRFQSENLQDRNQSQENQSRFQPENLPCSNQSYESQSRHQLQIQSRTQQGHNPTDSVYRPQKGHNPTDSVYHWAGDSSREGPQLNGTLRSRPEGHQPQRPHVGNTAAWRPTPPPPPPRTSASTLTSFRSETEQFATITRGRYPPDYPTAQKPLNPTGEGCYTNPYSSAPSLYHPSREPPSYTGSMAQLSRWSAIPIPVAHRSTVEPPGKRFQPVSSRAHSPLPPFPDVVGAPDYHTLPPPPPPDLMESYLPPPPMFHSPPPPVSNTPRFFSHAPGRADSRGNLAADRREMGEDVSRGAPTVEAALFAAILRRRQAIEGGSRQGVRTES